MKIILAPRLFLILAALAAMPFVLSACDTIDDQDDNAPHWQTQQQPPAPMEPEVIPPMDPQTQIWRPGYWALEGGRFVWIEGKIIGRPNPTAVWGAARWVHHTYGWSFEAGHWE